MKRYKYIGTEEQLVERGFSIFSNFSVKSCGNNILAWIYILTDKSVIVKPLMKDAYLEPTPYIQDLIDDGLVEVLS